jgi:hypothetical protein
MTNYTSPSFRKEVTRPKSPKLMTKERTEVRVSMVPQTESENI